MKQRFKVTKEEFARVFDNINVKSKATHLTLEGEAVEELKKKCKGALKRNPNCSGCNKPQPKIEEIKVWIDDVSEEGAPEGKLFKAMRDKLNELVRAFNITNNTK